MASTDHAPQTEDQVLDRHDVNDNRTGQDDRVRSWLYATSPSTRPLSLTGNGEPSSTLHASRSRPEVYELYQHGYEPPPYTVYDPAQDQPGTHQSGLDDTGSKKAKLYVPFYLRTWTFVIFAFIFAAMLVAVEVMHQISNENRGLGTQVPSRHYLWTYGPALLLCIVASFWGQVEYRMKQLMPWKTMTKEPVSAEETLLMDYVSPWNVTALITSLRTKHYAVTLGITGSLLLKLAIMISTALFTLEPRRMLREGKPMQLNDAFTSFSSYGNNSFIPPVLTAFGVGRYNLTYPPGTTVSSAVQSFEPVQNITDSSSVIYAEVDVFYADLSCEAATVSHASDSQCSQAFSTSCDTVYYNLTVISNSDSCITNATQVSAAIDGPSKQYYGSVTTASCIGRPTNTNVMRYAIVSGHESIDYARGAGNATKFTALICEPTYELCRVPVGIYLDGSIKDIYPSSDNSSCSSIADVQDWDIGNAVMSSLEAAAGSSLVDFSLPHNVSGDIVNFDMYFAAMDATSKTIDISLYFDASYLEDSARRLFSTTAAQIAKLHLTKPSTLRIVGATISSEERLFVRTAPVRILEIIFAILIAIAMVVLLLRPSAATPSDTSTLAGVATVMARSSQTSSALSGLGRYKHSDIELRLTGRTCHTIVNTRSDKPAFRLITTAVSDIQENSPAGSEELDWWQPFSMTTYARASLIILPLAVIATLEAVYQHSDRENGLANIEDSEHLRYAWTLVPTLIMTLVQTGFHMVDFSTRVFQPYETLSRGRAAADRSVNVNYLAQITPITIWKAFFNKHYPVVATGITMFLASALIIVSSGLYTTAAVESYMSAPIDVLTSINNTEAWRSPNNTVSPKNANAVSTLIAEANMSYPKWTYNGYVLPELDTAAFLLNQFGSKDAPNTTSVRVEMPAIYASLNCTHAIPSISFDDYSSGSVSSLKVPVPLGCGDVCAEKDNQSDDCDTSNSSVYELGMILQGGSSAYGIVHVPGGEGQKIPDRCPQLALVYGQGTVRTEAGSSIINLTIDAAVCSPVVYQVMTNVTFALPSFVIESLDPDMSTRQVLALGGTNKATLPIRDYLTPTDWGVDSFFSGLAPGRNGSIWTDFVGQNNFQHFSSHVDDLYSTIYSQWLNMNGRVSPPANETIANAVVIDPLRMRLKQSSVSTRILEALLAVMTICIATAFFLMDTRKLLPCNPCSIGAMASLLAGSDILESIPEGSEWLDRKELKRRRMFSAHTFTLGWWEGIGGKKRFGIYIGDPNRADSG